MTLAMVLILPGALVAALILFPWTRPVVLVGVALFLLHTCS